MSDDEEATQITRAHEAKRRGIARVGRVDGGAVAVGLVVALAAFAPTMADIVPLWVALVIVAIGLFMGGYVSGFLRASETVCEACHGALVGVAFVAVVLAVVASTVLAGGHPQDLALARLVDEGAPFVGTAVLLAVGFGTLGGYVSIMDSDDPTS